MTGPCLNKFCNGDGWVEYDEPPKNQPAGFVWPPTNCRPCRTWNNSRQTFIVTCTNCRQRRYFTDTRQIWLKKRLGVPAIDIERGELCPQCLEANPEERARRAEQSRFLRAHEEAYKRTHIALKLDASRLAAEGRARTSRHVADIEDRLNKAQNEISSAICRAYFDERMDTIGERFQTAAWRLLQEQNSEAGAVLRSLGRPELSRHPELGSDLLKAIDIVLTEHKEIPGLKGRLPKQRGVDPGSWLEELGSKYRITGPIYEMIGTAALVQGVCKGLEVFPLDSIAFGGKFPAGYACLPDDKAYSAMKGTGRTSIEADLLIYRPPGPPWFTSTTIGVDFKYRGSGLCSRSKDLEAQVAGVVAALLEGNLDQFHFVSNTGFSKGFADLIDEANTTLSSAHAHTIELHSNVGLK